MDVQKVHAGCYITTMNNKQKHTRDFMSILTHKNARIQKHINMLISAAGTSTRPINRFIIKHAKQKIAAEIIAEVKLKRPNELMGVYLMGDAITRQACQQKANKLVDTIVRTLGA